MSRQREVFFTEGGGEIEVKAWFTYSPARAAAITVTTAITDVISVEAELSGRVAGAGAGVSGSGSGVVVVTTASQQVVRSALLLAATSHATPAHVRLAWLDFCS